MSQQLCWGASGSQLGLLSQEWWAAFLLGCGLASEHPSPHWAGAGRWERAGVCHSFISCWAPHAHE